MLKEKILGMLNKFVIKKVTEKLNNVISESNEHDTEAEKLKEQYIYDPTNTPSKELMESIDYTSIKEPVILNPEGKYTVMLVDDVDVTDIMYRQDMKKMTEVHGVDPYKDFKLVKCLGNQAGFQAYKYVILEGNKVDFGVCDITLGHQLRVLDGYYMEIDGIDIAYYIKQANPNFKFLLCTAHTLNNNNSTITKYNNKIKKNFPGKELKDFYLNKNSYRIDKFYDLTYGSLGIQYGNQRELN